MASMASLLASFFLLISMHFSNARLLPAAIINPAKPHPISISLKVSENISQIGSPVTPSPKGNAKESTKIDRVFNQGSSHNEHLGSEIVDQSSFSQSHHVALLVGKHLKDAEIPPYFEKEEVIDPRNDDVVVMDYNPPHRKTPIHNK
ncbi:hypothetical protein SSX86_018151 [Deinandra increscens subsp. villosa]|uniref:Uncharacterized protein n=1 Tax=Deinandra increscens subsp. villosa TaxID=3103831 RepID=A0AAP0CQ72_9ASTR